MIGVVGLLLLLSDDRKNPSPAQQHSFIFINSSIKNMLVSMCGWECATVCVCVFLFIRMRKRKCGSWWTCASAEGICLSVFAAISHR